MTVSTTPVKRVPRQLLVVALDRMRLGLSVERLVETVRMVAITLLPGAPQVVEGVIDYRGRLAVVLDIRRRFGLPPAGPSARQYLVLAQLPERLVAIRVDELLDLIEIDEAQLECGTDITGNSDYIAGVARLATGLVVIHDLGQFLDGPEAAQLDRALDQRTP